MLVKAMQNRNFTLRNCGLGGFTLIEMMVTIAIISVMLVLVAPSFSDFLRKQRLVATTDSITSAIGQARTRALAQNVYVTIAPIDGDWRNGWRVFSEGQNPDGVYDDGTDTLINQYDAAPSNMKVDYNSTAYVGGVGAATGNYLIYSPAGYTVSKLKQPQVAATFNIYYQGTASPSRVVIVNALGRARSCDPDTAVKSSCLASLSQ
jgi:type IV fimbrial biogenesis protein FimT